MIRDHRTASLLAVAVLAAMTVLLGGWVGEDDRDDGLDLDRFGIRQLLPTLRGGTVWTADWDRERRFSRTDPDDPWFDTDHGAAAYAAGGGLLRICGRAPRMYVHDPAGVRQWGDVEVTVYARRERDTATPYAGIVAVARSNHLDTDSPGALCDTRGYGGRLRYDGLADIEKETAHPANEAIGSRRVFARGMPYGEWIGLKLLVYDRSDGVHIELWRDLSDGAGGGDWRRITAVIDDGDLFGQEPCAPGIDPRAALTAAPTREGSESGLPNASVYFRSDGVLADGLIYKRASVREVDAPASRLTP